MVRYYPTLKLRAIRN